MHIGTLKKCFKKCLKEEILGDSGCLRAIFILKFLGD